jgi:hypothetical protein
VSPTAICNLLDDLDLTVLQINTCILPKHQDLSASTSSKPWPMYQSYL